MKSDPGVSVILATYNSAAFLERSVRSVLKQTYRNFELIIVDDGSTDNTSEVLLPLLTANKNIVYHRHTNRRHPLSLNAGMDLAKGDYITFIDSDDEYESEHIELRVNHIRETGLDLIHSPAKLVGNETDFWIPDANDSSRLIHINDCIIGGTIFGKAEVFSALGGFRDMYSHDSDFVHRAIPLFKIGRFEIPTYIYHRDNPGSVTAQMKVHAGQR